MNCWQCTSLSFTFHCNRKCLQLQIWVPTHHSFILTYADTALSWYKSRFGNRGRQFKSFYPASNMVSNYWVNDHTINVKCLFVELNYHCHTINCKLSLCRIEEFVKTIEELLRNYWGTFEDSETKMYILVPQANSFKQLLLWTRKCINTNGLINTYGVILWSERTRCMEIYQNLFSMNWQ